VLGPSVALDLTLDRIQPWTNDIDDDWVPRWPLFAAPTAAGDVDLVVGMIGSLPRESDSLHDEGMATLLGKYVVVRGASRIGEVDSIQLTFTELGDAERARLLDDAGTSRARRCWPRDPVTGLGPSTRPRHRQLDAGPIYEFPR